MKKEKIIYQKVESIGDRIISGQILQHNPPVWCIFTEHALYLGGNEKDVDEYRKKFEI